MLTHTVYYAVAVAFLAFVALRIFYEEQKCIRWRKRGKTAFAITRDVFAATQGSQLTENTRFIGMLSAVTRKCGAPQTLFVSATKDEYESPALSISSPFLRTPVIILVNQYIRRLNFTDKELEAIIAHEIGHFRRRYTFFEILHYVYVIFYMRKRFLQNELGADLYAAHHVNISQHISYLEKAEAYVTKNTNSKIEIQKRLAKLRSLAKTASASQA